MKKEMTFSRLKNEFSLNLSMLQLKCFKQDFSLRDDFSRRHLFQNPPALAGGRLNVPIYLNLFSYIKTIYKNEILIGCLKSDISDFLQQYDKIMLKHEFY